MPQNLYKQQYFLPVSLYSMSSNGNIQVHSSSKSPVYCLLALKDEEQVRNIHNHCTGGTGVNTSSNGEPI